MEKKMGDFENMDNQALIKACLDEEQQNQVRDFKWYVKMVLDDYGAAVAIGAAQHMSPCLSKFAREVAAVGDDGKSLRPNLRKTVRQAISDHQICKDILELLKLPEFDCGDLKSQQLNSFMIPLLNGIMACGTQK
jgi:hypothetical protein